MSVAIESPKLSSTLLRVTWLSIGLGIFMEILVIIVISVWGNISSSKPFIADLVQKVSWSFIVCAGLALGSVVSKLKAQYMGIAGLLAAPFAFVISRSLHKSATQALTIPAVSDSASPLVIAAIKGVEYAILGIAIAWIAKRVWGGFLAHISAGLLVGVVFGGAIMLYVAESALNPIPTAAFISRTINEVFFPVGCAVVLFIGTVIASRIK
ncbi:MAG: hypothetical protein ACT4NX_09555 [Deltaproteobacteria bacterium]